MELCVFIVARRRGDGRPETTTTRRAVRSTRSSRSLGSRTRSLLPHVSAGAVTEVMHTQKRRHVLLQPEPGFWLVLIARNPTAPNANGDAAAAAVTHGNFQDALEEELQDAVLQSLLRRAHDAAHLLPRSRP